MLKQPAVTGRSRTTASQHDIALPRAQAIRMSLPPTRSVAPFQGKSAQARISRRVALRAGWMVQSAGTCLGLSSPASTAPGVQFLVFVLERLALEADGPRPPALMTLNLHAATSATAWATDFARVARQLYAMMRVGACKTYFQTKLWAYANADLPRSAVIHVDEACDPVRLTRENDGVRTKFEGAIA